MRTTSGFFAVGKQLRTGGRLQAPVPAHPILVSLVGFVISESR